jgi:hypothetical protein
MDHAGCLICRANLLLGHAKADVRRNFHILKARRYLQASFVASSNCSRTRGVGRSRHISDVLTVENGVS